jgi:hypothetical protein
MRTLCETNALERNGGNLFQTPILISRTHRHREGAALFHQTRRIVFASRTIQISPTDRRPVVRNSPAPGHPSKLKSADDPKSDSSCPAICGLAVVMTKEASGGLPDLLVRTQSPNARSIMELSAPPVPRSSQRKMAVTVHRMKSTINSWFTPV